jgi:uncharacterized membrane protein YqhA
MRKFLSACRYLLIVPVVGCVIMTGGVVVMGFGRIVTSIKRLVEMGGFAPKASKYMSLAVIEIIDLFLVGTIAYITAVGLYKLFIDKTQIQLPVKLKINDLSDLENKIIGVIIAALAVAFLGKAAGTDDTSSLLNFGGGIALVITSLSIFMKFNTKKTNSDKKIEK